MTRSTLAGPIGTALVIAAVLAGGAAAQRAPGEETGQDSQEPPLEAAGDVDQETGGLPPVDLLQEADEGRAYSDITITPDEAYLDLRADTSATLRLLGEILESQGDSVPRGAVAEAWFRVGDTWMRVEPLPYMRGAWSRMRLRVGAFETEAERRRAEELLSALAFRLDEELGVAPEDDQAAQDPGELVFDPGADLSGGATALDGEASRQALAGGYRAGGATLVGQVSDEAGGVAAQQPLQVSVPVTIYAEDRDQDVYDDGYASSYTSPGYGYGFYGSYAYTPYAYCSPWAYSWLSYSSWNYGYKWGWHGYGSYYAWCSPYSGWGWHPYGSWWSGYHYTNCACSLCASVVYYADCDDDWDDDCDDEGENDELAEANDGGGGDGGAGADDDGGGDDVADAGGGAVGTGTTDGSGSLGGNGGGLVAGALDEGSLSSAAAPEVSSAPADVLGFEPRVGGLDSADGPGRRAADGLLGGSLQATPGPQGEGTLATPASGGLAGSGVVRTVPPSRPPTAGHRSWTPTVRTVTARTVRVGGGGSGEDAHPSVRSSLPVRSSSGSAGGWSSSSAGSERPAVTTLSFGSAPVIRASTPSVVSRAVAASGSRGNSGSTSSVTEHGTLRSTPTSVVSTSVVSTGASSGARTISSPTYTTTRGSSLGARSSSRPTFNRSSPIPSRGTSLTPSRPSVGSSGRRSPSAGRSGSSGRAGAFGAPRGSASAGSRSSTGGLRSGRGR